MAGAEDAAFKHIQAHLNHESGQNFRMVDIPSGYRCGFCFTPGFGPRYLCGACNLNVHRYCGTQLRGQLPCFLHPQDNHCMSIHVLQQGVKQCHVCGEYIAGYHYSCEAKDHDVHVHPICFQLRHASASIARFAGIKLNHLTHTGHDLKEVYLPKRYPCDGCGTPGSGLRLRCGDCDFNLHPYCYSCPTNQKPCFRGHTKHSSSLMGSGPPRKQQCHLCGTAVAKTDTTVGMHYKCETSGALAHPICVQLLQEEKAITSASTDKTVRLLRAARRVAGRIIVRKTQMAFLTGGIFFATGGDSQPLDAAWNAPPDVAAASPSYVGVQDPPDVPVDAPVDYMLPGVADDGDGGGFFEMLMSGLEHLSNLI